MVSEDEGGQARDVRRGHGRAVPSREVIRRHGRKDRDTRCADVDLGTEAAEARWEVASAPGIALQHLLAVEAVLGELAEAADRPDREGGRQVGRELDRAGGISRRHDAGDSEAARMGDALREDGVGGSAPKAHADHVDRVLDAVVQGRDEVAEAPAGKHPQDVDLRRRCEPGDAARLARSSGDHAGAVRAVTDLVLGPVVGTAFDYVAAGSDGAEVAVRALRGARVDHGDPDAGAVELGGELIQPHRLLAPA